MINSLYDDKCTMGMSGHLILSIQEKVNSKGKRRRRETNKRMRERVKKLLKINFIDFNLYLFENQRMFCLQGLARQV